MRSMNTVWKRAYVSWDLFSLYFDKLNVLDSRHLSVSSESLLYHTWMRQSQCTQAPRATGSTLVYSRSWCSPCTLGAFVLQMWVAVLILDTWHSLHSDTVALNLIILWQAAIQIITIIMQFAMEDATITWTSPMLCKLENIILSSGELLSFGFTWC